MTSDATVSAEPRPARTWQHAAARAITEVFAPAVIITALFLAVGWHAGQLRGLAWGLAGTAFASIGPFAVIVTGVIRGRFTDHHLTARRDRTVPLLATAAIVTGGIVALAAAGAPRDIVATEAAMLAGLCVSTPITLIWKISFHAGVAAAVAAITTIVYGPPLIAAWAVIALIGWSRVRLGGHTPAQVIAAVPVGAVTAAITFLAIH